MKILHTPGGDNKSLKLKSYNAIISEEEIEEIADKLFGAVEHSSKINSSIIDDILVKYIKTIVANTFIKQIKPVKGDIYKITVVANSKYSIDMMLTLHEKLNEYFY